GDGLGGGPGPPAGRAPHAAAGRPGRGGHAALLRLRGPLPGPAAARLGGPLPGGLLLRLRAGRRTGPAHRPRAAARLRDRQGGLRGALRGPAPPRVAARTASGRAQARRLRCGRPDLTHPFAQEAPPVTPRPESPASQPEPPAGRPAEPQAAPPPAAPKRKPAAKKSAAAGKTAAAKSPARSTAKKAGAARAAATVKAAEKKTPAGKTPVKKTAVKKTPARGTAEAAAPDTTAAGTRGAGQPVPPDMEIAVSPAVGAEDRERLLSGTHHAPHDVLGAHPVPGGVVFRVFKPYALAVTVVSGGLRVELHDDGAGFFSGLLPLREVPAYHLLVAYEGTVHETEDAYRFLPTLGELDLHLIGEGRHEELWTVLGAHPMTHEGVRGTRFSVWAPNARAVRVAGTFNFWDGTAFPMRSLGSTGVW